MRCRGPSWQQGALRAGLPSGSTGCASRLVPGFEPAAVRVLELSLYRAGVLALELPGPLRFGLEAALPTFRGGKFDGSALAMSRHGDVSLGQAHLAGFHQPMRFRVAGLTEDYEVVHRLMATSHVDLVMDVEVLRCRARPAAAPVVVERLQALLAPVLGPEIGLVLRAARWVGVGHVALRTAATLDTLHRGSFKRGQRYSGPR
jgi:hypothetical protein